MPYAYALCPVVPHLSEKGYTTIERSRLRQLLLINWEKFLAKQLKPLLSKTLRTVSTFVWGKSRSIEIACCLLLTITVSTKGNGFDSGLSLI